MITPQTILIEIVKTANKYAAPCEIRFIQCFDVACTTIIEVEIGKVRLTDKYSKEDKTRSYDDMICHLIDMVVVILIKNQYGEQPTRPDSEVHAAS